MKKIRDLFSKILNKIDKYINSKDEYYFLRLSYLFLGFVFSQSFVTSILFILHIKIGIYNFLLGTILWLATYYLLFYKRTNNKKNFYGNLVFTLILIGMAMILSTILLENSWDGWAYHIPSVIEMKNGWNPVYEHNENIGIWSLHYPKFIWMYGAVLYNIFGSMSMGTSFNMIISFSCFFLILHILKKLDFKTINSLIYSLFISFNFISVRQFFSYYNDGVQGVCIVSVIILLYYSMKRKTMINNNYEFLLIFLNSFMYLSILANIKFNGALYAFILACIGLIFLLTTKVSKLKILLLSTLLGIFVLIPATTVYLPNYIYHHNLGYPIIGKDKIDIINVFEPQFIKGTNKLTAYVKSLSCDRRIKDYCKLKTILNINYEDIQLASIADNSLNGFGPLYQVMFLLFLILLIGYIILTIVNLKKHNDHNFKIKYSELIVYVIYTLFFLITPATWWFRYVSYMYSFPIVFVILNHEKYFNNNIYRILWKLIVALYTINLVFFGLTRLYSQINFTKKMILQTNEIKNYSTKKTLYLKEIDVKDNYYKRIVRDEIFNKINVEYKIYNDNKKCNLLNYYYVYSIEMYECD